MNSKHIVFATFGSLGDLHPYIAIALELKRRGHRPLIATFDGLREAVGAAGIEFTAMRPGMDELGDRLAVMQRLLEPWRGPEYLVRGMFMPRVRESYDDLLRAAGGADLLITHPLAFAGPLIAEQRGMRWVSTLLSPLSLFSAIDPPLFAAAPWLQYVRKFGVAPYRLMFGLARLKVRQWEKPLYRLRAELGLPPARGIAQLEGQYSPLLNLALFSRVLASPQADWPEQTVLCGFPRYDSPPADAGTQAELDAFFAAGDPPIVFGLGSSAVLIAGDFWHEAIEAAQRLKRRAILLTGAPPESLGAVPPTVKVFQYLPYSAVFPRTAAVVHSGGIGTLAQALAAGRPQLIVPVAFDQPDNARRAAQLGVALTVPFKKATADAMTEALEMLLASPDYAARARAIGEQVGREDGARNACDELERVMR